MEELDRYLIEYDRRAVADVEQAEWERDDTRIIPRSRPVTKPDDEYLGVVYLRSAMHCGFPTARRTLCGLEPDDDTAFWSVSPAPETMRPKCRACLSVIRAWMDEVVDGHNIPGIPDNWQDAYVRARVS